jgi:hypothetical protein
MLLSQQSMQAVLWDSTSAARRPSELRQPPRSCSAVQPLVNRRAGSPFLTPRPPFRAVQTREQHQNRAGPHDSHREYQCDRFLRAHEAILGTGVVFRGRSSSHSVHQVRSRSIVNSE